MKYAISFKNGIVLLRDSSTFEVIESRKFIHLKNIIFHTYYTSGYAIGEIIEKKSLPITNKGYHLTYQPDKQKFFIEKNNQLYEVKGGSNLIVEQKKINLYNPIFT